jgi:RimJ/RimL family protein N-acetyltransferase
LDRAFPWLRKKAAPPEGEDSPIRGRKVVIREKRIEDAKDDYAWRTDEELARLDATRPLSMSYDTFLRYAKEELLYSSHSSKRLAIDNLDGCHIGNCMYYDIDERRGQAELGIMIGDREYWGKGYGSDAVEALLAHIFTATSLNRIYLHTLEWNSRARRSFAKSRFRDVKDVRRGGLHFILMEVRREQWESDAASTDGSSPEASRKRASGPHVGPGGAG